MVNIQVTRLIIGGRSYSKDKGGYPALPTVFSGVDISWGAGSCIEHPDPARAQVSLWVPKTHESFVPALGEVVEVSVVDSGAGTFEWNVFVGKVESVKLKDDHDANGGYRINVVAADALAEASRLRLSDEPWGYDSVVGRTQRIYEASQVLGVKFSAVGGDYEAEDTKLVPRDVDSFPALEAYQRAMSAYGHTAISVDNEVRPSRTLRLPLVLSASTTGLSTLYSWLGTPYASKSVKKVSNVVTRTNEVTNPVGGYGASYTTAGYTTTAGTGGSVSLGAGQSGTRDFQTIDRVVNAYWTVKPTGGVPAITYTQTGVSGTTGTKVSAGAWVEIPYIMTPNSVKVQVRLLNGATPAGTGLSTAFTLVKGEWKWVKLDGVTATGVFDRVEVSIQIQSMPLGDIRLNGVLIEKAAVGGPYFDGGSYDAAMDIVSTEAPGIVALDSSMVVDNVFEIDTSLVVNEINVEMKRVSGNAPGFYNSPEPTVVEDFNQIFTDEAGSRKTTPQTRSIASDWAIHTFEEEELPTSVMVTKGKLLLAGQSKAQWRLSEAVSLLPEFVPSSQEFMYLFRELDRFGALIRIDDAPALVSKYMRIRGGRFVFGEEVIIEFEVEPVEYSAPVPLTKNSLFSDDVAVGYQLQNFHTLTSNDLRAIGAR